MCYCFFLWGDLKNLIYATRVETEEYLVFSILTACETVSLRIQVFFGGCVRIWFVAAGSAVKFMAATSTRSCELIENDNININVCIVNLINIHENEVKNVKKAFFPEVCARGWPSSTAALSTPISI